MSEDTAKDLARLQRRLKALEENNGDLELRIEDLEVDLAQAKAIYVDPYAMPAEVVKVLIKQLAGWPAKRWCELAGRIEAHVHRSIDA